MIDDRGQVLDAEYSVEPDGDQLAVIFESMSGRASGRPPRNTDYRAALELVLRRLQQRRAVIEAAIVDSRRTRLLPESSRSLLSEPVRLVDVSDPDALRRQLTNAQTTIGQAPDARLAGNSTKRIRLRLAVPGYGPSDAERLAADLAVASSPESDGDIGRLMLNQWWLDDPAERYWMEITNRPDFGANVRALQRDGSGRENWSYALVTALRPGDVVLHWHKTLNATPGLVGYSTAVEGPFDDVLVWNARGSYGRRRADNDQPQPAWRFDLASYTALPSPIDQEAFRRVETRLHETYQDLRNRHVGPLYFPFSFFTSRPLRVMQAYMVKVPAVVLDAVPELATIPRPRLSARQSTPRSPAAHRSRAARSNGSGYLTDQVLKVALEKHAVRIVMDHYRDVEGYEVEDVGSQESYDVRATRGTEELHIEVKGSSVPTDNVELTANEVGHAHVTDTHLVIVDEIRWRRLSDGTIEASGGRARRWTAWTPAEEYLKITRYRYRPPAHTDELAVESGW